MSLNIVSLNIEEDRHLDRFVPLVQELRPDVVLLQEALNKDVPYLEDAFKMKGVFTAHNFLKTNNQELNRKLQLGILTLSSLPMLKNNSFYYRGNYENLPHIYTGEPEKMARAILVTEYVKEEQSYCLINIHFTWSAGGKPTDQQHDDLNKLFEYFSGMPDFILCGDFNTPRGAAIFDRISSKYKDNIPPEITTTIDGKFHKAGNLNLVIDGLFTTQEYEVNSVRIVGGVSDHTAIVANIKKLRN